MLDRPTEDLLSSVLGVYQLRAAIEYNPQYCGAFELQEEQEPDAQFHIIDRGDCLLRPPGRNDGIPLSGGDFIVVPRGHPHRITSRPGARADSFSSLLCGSIRFVTGARNPILDALPDFLVVRADEAGGAFRQLAELIFAEAHSARAGSQVVIDRLTDTLLVMGVRHYVTTDRNPRGIVAALADRRLARALLSMHESPGTSWSVARLAQLAGMSRTAFAERFAEILGTSPIHYLTEWRMTRAEQLLRESRQSVAAVAEQLGYQTEAAFRRSFKRVLGYGPGQVRRQAAA